MSVYSNGIGYKGYINHFSVIATSMCSFVPVFSFLSVTALYVDLKKKFPVSRHVHLSGHHDVAWSR